MTLTLFISEIPNLLKTKDLLVSGFLETEAFSETGSGFGNSRNPFLFRNYLTTYILTGSEFRERNWHPSRNAPSR